MNFFYRINFIEQQQQQCHNLDMPWIGNTPRLLSVLHVHSDQQHVMTTVLRSFMMELSGYSNWSTSFLLGTQKT